MTLSHQTMDDAPGSTDDYENTDSFNESEALSETEAGRTLPVGVVPPSPGQVGRLQMREVCQSPGMERHFSRHSPYYRTESADNIENAEAKAAQEGLQYIDRMRAGKQQARQPAAKHAEASSNATEPSASTFPLSPPQHHRKRVVINHDDVGILSSSWGRAVEDEATDDESTPDASVTQREEDEERELLEQEERASDDPLSEGKELQFDLDEREEEEEEEEEEFPALASLFSLPRDLQLRVMALVPERNRLLATSVSKPLRRLVQDPLLWRHVNLTSCSSHITDATFLRILSISHGLESLILCPPASPPFLTWMAIQSLAAHASCSHLRSLVLSNCEGLLSNSPKFLRPAISSLGGVRCKLPATLRFRWHGPSASSSDRRTPRSPRQQFVEAHTVFAEWGRIEEAQGPLVWYSPPRPKSPSKQREVREREGERSPSKVGERERGREGSGPSSAGTSSASSASSSASSSSSSAAAAAAAAAAGAHEQPALL